MSRNTLLRERLFASLGAVMCQKSRKFYVLRVDDLKPVIWEHAAETLDADDLVYVIYPEVQNVAITDVRIGVTPQLREASQDQGYECVTRETRMRYASVTELTRYPKDAGVIA